MKCEKFHIETLLHLLRSFLMRIHNWRCPEHTVYFFSRRWKKWQDMKKFFIFDKANKKIERILHQIESFKFGLNNYNLNLKNGIHIIWFSFYYFLRKVD